MPQVKELSFPPLNYQPPTFSLAQCEMRIASLVRRRDQLDRARDVLVVLRDRITPVSPHNDDLPWFPQDETDMFVWATNAASRGIARTLETNRYYAYESGRQAYGSMHNQVTGMLSDVNADLRSWHAAQALAQAPQPDDIVLRRDQLRSQLKGIPQIPLRSVNLARVNGIPYLTWQFENIYCKPNAVPDGYRAYGINAGDIPAFPLPRMAFSMPLQRMGYVKVKPVRNDQRFHAFSSNSVHPHHMSERSFCLGDYASAIEELKMKHDFIGIIMLYLDFVQKCEPTDAAGRTYPRFIEQQISNQLGGSTGPRNVVLALPSIPYYEENGRDHAVCIRFAHHTESSIIPRQTPDDGWNGTLTGRLARLRGQWVFQPGVRGTSNTRMARVLTYEETCNVRDGFLSENFRNFFAKDEAEYQLLARMVNENTPIQYNEQTNLVLNALPDEDVNDDDDTWNDQDALSSHDDDTVDNYDTEHEDDTEEAEDPEPYVDEPY